MTTASSEMAFWAAQDSMAIEWPVIPMKAIAGDCMAVINDGWRWNGGNDNEMAMIAMLPVKSIMAMLAVKAMLAFPS